MSRPKPELNYFMIIGYLVQGIVSLQLQTYSACYGTTGLANFLQPSCSSGEVIFVRAVYSNAKLQSSNCPQEITPLNSGTTPASCCEYGTGDCETLYDATSVYSAYYSDCNNRQSCTEQVAWMETTCNHTEYIPRTHYMVMQYYCVSDEALDLCADITMTDTTTFLTNIGKTVIEQNCSCSVEVSCDTTVTITALDLRFAEQSGVCQQKIEINDGGTQTIIDCSNNNNYFPTLLYTSSSHFIEVNLVVTSGVDFRYLILIEGTDNSGDITLSCGSSKLSSPANDGSSLLDCPSSTLSSSILPINPSPSTTYTEPTDDSASLSMSVTSEPTDTLLSTMERSLTSEPLAVSSESYVETISEMSFLSTTVTMETASNIIHPSSASMDDMMTSNPTQSGVTTTSIDPSSTGFTYTSGVRRNPSSSAYYESSSSAYNQTESPKNPAQSNNTDDEGTSYIWIIPIVLILVILCVGLLIYFYRDRIRDCLFGAKKQAEVEDIKTNEKDKLPETLNPEPDYDKLFSPDPHQKFGYLPPMAHAVVLPFSKEKTFHRNNSLLRSRTENSLNRSNSVQIANGEVIPDPEVTAALSNGRLDNEKMENENPKENRKKSKKKSKLRKSKHRQIYGNKPSLQENLLGDIFPETDKKALTPTNGQLSSGPPVSKLLKRQSTLDVINLDGSLERSVTLKF